ncbi:DUF4347 domain-containing protein [Pseudomonas sp. COR58]|uniref:DUF4347 domain-containing protein n=1 Tax=Pseudomonas ekonensis TaxID=2842353 RepID=A0ABS6PBH8_9PSED|nr:DUF4347 domain-containing protein [Pseudomonas ekonensis]MBV4457830.1 DUF4347 domain-containing protein [Pseudomonas ekonensis]
MYFWYGVVTQLAKHVKGKPDRAIIKDLSSGRTLLVALSTNALVRINLDKTKIHNASDNAPWADDTEKPYVQVGTEVVLTTEVNHFPTDASQVVSINFRYAIELVTGNLLGPLPVRGIVVIYHDFLDEKSRGDSGAAFAKSIECWSEKLGRPCWLINANSTLSSVVARLEMIAAQKKGVAVVDTILIVTHGREGCLYIGDPNDVKDENFIAEAETGRRYSSAQAFGAKLQSLFGADLAIGIYSCNFLNSAAGGRVAIELRSSSGARAVYGAQGTVHLMPNMGQRPTALCDECYAVFSADEIKHYASEQIPVFDI